MNIYYLCKRDEQPAHPLSNPDDHGTSHRVVVRGDADWYGARLRALQHAQGVGARVALVVVGRARVYGVASDPASRRPVPHYLQPHHAHGLLLYLDRLHRQHTAAVLLPSLQAVPYLYPVGGDFTPVIPTVSSYTVEAALGTGQADGATLEYALCVQGYRVLTLGQYAVELEGDAPLDTYGSKTKWKQANEKAIHPYL